MVDKTPHRRVEERSRLNLFSTSVNDSVNDIPDCPGTPNSETAGERTEDELQPRLQPPLLQTFPSDVLPLETICQTGELRFQELAFTVGHTAKEKTPTLTVTQRELYFHPPFGYTSRVHIVITGNHYVVNILSSRFQSGTVGSDTEVYQLCEMFSGQSPYKFCPGIDWELYEEYYHTVIRFHLKSVRYCTSPFQRVDSVNCVLWFKPPVNASLSEKFSKEVMCTACKRLKSDLDWQRKRTLCESPSRKVKRQAASSKAKLTYMSPASQLKRKQNALVERNNDKLKLAKYESTEVTLSEDQHEDMSAVVNKIEEVSKDCLEKIFAEGDAHGVGNKIREIWVTDRREQLEQFNEDQARNSMFLMSYVNA